MPDIEWKFNRYEKNQGISRKLAKGLDARIFVGESSMLSFVQIESHAEGKIHSHPEEQWGVLLEGECIRIQDGEEIRMKTGDFWHTPGGVSHGIRTEESGAVILDIFSPPRLEYQRKGEGFEDV